MERAETIKLFAIFKTAYPRFFISQDKTEARLQIDLWSELLGDLPFSVIDAAVKRLILDSPYPPAISDVRRKAIEIMKPQQMTAAEAWEEVNRVLDRFGYYRQVEAMQSIPPLAARVVRAMGFNTLCLTQNISVERAQFLRMYEQFAGREQDNTLLPDKLKMQIQAIVGNLGQGGRLTNGS